MAGTPFKEGPEFLVTTSEDVYNPAANTYSLIRHIHIANTNASARTVSLWVGATGAETNGTEIVEGKSIAGNDVYDMYFPSGLRLASTDFLVGMSSADATSLVITVTGEKYAA